MTTSHQKEQAERRAYVGSNTTTTYHQRAMAEIGLETQAQGRFSSKPSVTGSERVPQVPRMPATSPWAADIVPPEEALGWSVEAQEVTGNYHEVEASLAAPQASCLPPEGAEAREVDPQCAAPDCATPLGSQSGVPFLRGRRL
jgi:hypothetical protein